MKRLFLVSLFFLAVSAPAYAQNNDGGSGCYAYLDSTQYNSPIYNFCWLSGAICFQCVDASTGAGCASNSDICDPYGAAPKRQPGVLAFQKRHRQPKHDAIEMASLRPVRSQVGGTATPLRLVSNSRTVDLVC